MIDPHNREINYLRVSITDRCNLRCLYCMPKEGVSHAGHDDILRYEEIMTIVKAAARTGIAKVRITGGEPLVRRGIVDFAKQLRSVTGIEEVSLTTNGILLKNLAAALFESGIGRINISLDSLKAERYSRITRGGDISVTLAGIDEARKIGFDPIKINTVSIKGFNDDEPLDFARLALDNDLQVRFIELMPVGGKNKIGGFISNNEIYKRISARYAMSEINADGVSAGGPARLFAIEGGKGKIGFISPFSHNFCGTCNRLRLTASGALRTCLFSDEEVNLRDVLRSGCGAEEIEKIIKEMIISKPRAHRLTSSDAYWNKCRKEMFQIGG